MTFVVRLGEALVTEDARFVGLTRPAHPDNVVFAERVLTDPSGDGLAERQQVLDGLWAAVVGLAGHDRRKELCQVGRLQKRRLVLFPPVQLFEASEQQVVAARRGDDGHHIVVIVVVVDFRWSVVIR